MSLETSIAQAYAERDLAEALANVAVKERDLERVRNTDLRLRAETAERDVLTLTEQLEAARKAFDNLQRDYIEQRDRADEAVGRLEQCGGGEEHA